MAKTPLKFKPDSLEVMDPTELVAIGHALYGTRKKGIGTWQTQLGDAIGKTSTTIRNWAMGRHPPTAADSRHVRLHYWWCQEEVARKAKKKRKKEYHREKGIRNSRALSGAWAQHPKSGA